MSWKYFGLIVLPAGVLIAIAFGALSAAYEIEEAWPMWLAYFAFVAIVWYFAPRPFDSVHVELVGVDASASKPWVPASRRLPTHRHKVVVLTAECAIPLVGYVKYSSGGGHYWVVPGHGGTVLFWSDCVPLPKPAHFLGRGRSAR